MGKEPLSQEDERVLENWFRGFLIADIIFSVLYLLVDTEDPQAPEEIPSEIAFVLLALLVAGIASWIGLFLYKDWARHLYLALNAIALLVELNQVYTVADLVSWAIVVVVLVLAYGPLAYKFR